MEMFLSVKGEFCAFYLHNSCNFSMKLYDMAEHKHESQYQFTLRWETNINRV